MFQLVTGWNHREYIETCILEIWVLAVSQQNQDGSVNLKVTHVAIDANNIDMLSVSSEFIKLCNMVFWKRYGTLHNI